MRLSESMRNRNSHPSHPLAMPDISPGGRALLFSAVAWTLAWKGASLWRAARNGSKPWFVALLLSNSLGVLDAIYLLAVERRGRKAIAAAGSIADSVGRQ
jgi:hypothetical protein